jgi:hypothetical protein
VKSRSALLIAQATGLIALVLFLSATGAAAAPAGAPVPEFWHRIPTVTQPSPRQSPGMTYDPASKEVLLFGGYTPQGFSAVTWAWRDGGWTQLDPAESPSPRNAPTMAYDPASKQVILYGGSGAGWLGDTWLWNGTSWASTGQDLSSPECAGEMAYDSVTKQVILFTEVNERGTTYVWHGAKWVNTHAPAPPAVCGSSMAYDKSTDQLLLFGGWNDAGSSDTNQTWQWTGSSWQQLVPIDSPPPVGDACMAFDPVGHDLVLFGGTSFGSGGFTFADGTWIWTGTNWVSQPTTAAPTARSGCGTAGDPASMQVVLFGGSSAQHSNLGGTWIWH